MELQNLIAMEMEAVSGQDAELLEDVRYSVGKCGIENGWGACGGGSSGAGGGGGN